VLIERDGSQLHERATDQTCHQPGDLSGRRP
jgi:hypothetical protein